MNATVIWVCDRVLVGSFISCYRIRDGKESQVEPLPPIKKMYCYKLGVQEDGNVHRQQSLGGGEVPG